MKSKFRLSRLALFISIIVATVMSLSVAIFNEIKAYYSTDDKVPFTATLATGEKLKCYKMKDSENPDKKICSVSWLWADGNTIPTTLSIPEKVSLNDGDYEVKAVYKGGFRSCTFTEIILPQTVVEINEEAFAYCMNMTSFTIPYQVSRIAPSTFMDCQKLELFYYTGFENESDPTSAIIKKLGNSTVTEFGDHAFDNCVSLKGLYFPSSLRTIGNSAFQRCALLQSLFFPGENANKTNKIRVGAYAFADCPLLKTVYFEENLEYFGPYCFVNDKEDLTYTYTGSSEPISFDAHWRDKNITTSNDNKYQFLPWGQAKVHIDDDYPGLIFSYETSDQYLDCSGPGDKDDTYVKVIENSEEYVKISGFQEPFASLEGYYDLTTKTFTIPNYVHGRPVKSIGQNAFAGQPFKHIIFNANLVQIQNRAFYGCDDIESLNFNACTNLKEISYEIFQSTCPELFSDKDPTSYTKDQKYNDKLRSISLPNCLEYIGDSAFYNFTNLTDGISFKGTDPDAPSNLKIIGDFAFSVHRTKNLTASITVNDLISVELPNSLDDRYATGYNKNGTVIKAAKFYHPYHPWEGAGRVRRYAIGRFCFENQDILGSLTMEPATEAQAQDMDYTTSFMSNVVTRCNNVYKFQTNENFYLLGSDAFKLCPSLKEVFLHSEKADYHYAHGGAAFPWGIRDDCPFPGGASKKELYENGIFSGTSNDEKDGNKCDRPDVVVYVSGNDAPGLLNDKTKYRNGIYMWNKDGTPTFRTELDYSTGLGAISNRKSIPTFYGIDWEGDNKNVFYWKPGANGGTFKSLTEPYTLTIKEYGQGYISIVPKGEGYQIAKYYTDGAEGHYAEEIDLTSINDEHGDISGNLLAIASSAFATSSTKKLGLYFILPNTITTIEERAFFRKGDSKNAVRIVTTKKNNTIQVPTGETKTYAQIKSSYNTNVGGYCILPDNVTTVEANSFFNNNFNTIVFNSNIARLGASAFSTKQYTNRTTTIQFDRPTDSKFTVTNDGFYYTENAAKKTLVYQAAGSAEDTLTIADGTVAVGFRAAIGTNYKTVTIPDGLTTFYGGAFFNSKMTTVDGHLEDIKYICARTVDKEAEIYDNYNGAFPFDNYDVTEVTGYASNNDNYVNNARNGAFKSCSSLKNLDFSQMTSLKAIGLEAFSGCSNLENVSSKTYNIYDYTSKASGQAASLVDSPKVLDLSGATGLRKIQTNAFANVNKITHTILPTTVGKDISTESKLTLDNNGNTLPPKSVHLIGETYHQAGINHNNSSLNPRTHYPTNAIINDTTKNFWRIYVEDLPDGLTIEDYLANTGTESTIASEQYWTIYGDNYYLLKGYKQAKAFYTAVAAGTYTTPGQALTF